MKVKLVVGMLSLLVTGLTACESDEEMAPSASAGTRIQETNNPVVKTAGELDGSYAIAYFEHSDKDITSKYQGITFSFSPEGILMIEGDGVTLRGSYSLDNNLLRILLPANERFPELGYVWGVSELTSMNMWLITPYAGGPRDVVELRKVTPGKVSERAK